MSPFQQNIDTLPQLGAFYQKKLNKLNIFNLFDLLLYVPRLYEERKKTTSIREIILGDKNAIVGKILDGRVVVTRRRMLLVTLADGTGLLTLRFFHFYPNWTKQFPMGEHLYAFGEVRLVGGNFEMMHPECRLVEREGVSAESYAVYPLSEGLTQNRIRGFIDSAFLKTKSMAIAEDLPTEIIKKFHLEPFWSALQFIHYPPTNVVLTALNAYQHPAQKRLIFEELLAHRLAVRQPLKDEKATVIHVDKTKLHEFIKALPFELTNGQSQAITEIIQDLQQPSPMQRLLQGDVGSGKTIVAFLSALAAMQAGFQAALMAPTEILAEQLFEKAHALFTPLGFSIIALLGKMSTKMKQEAYAKIAGGEANFVIGTHAVIQDEVVFHNAGIIIIDEQHRFGVGQRYKLHQQAGGATHQLIMSATPIPRTLAMTLYADLAISNINELPKGRKGIETVLIADTRREEIIARLKEACLRGEQAYWICPLIEESLQLELEAVEATFKRLSQELPTLTIALLHGRMKGKEKSRVMQEFKAGKIQILVATTVVEVGVDVPNASIMIIENPERMGLSQLHQLRGRVGRGTKPSYCVLLYHPPLGETAMARLTTLRYCQNGFELAEKDLELRGPGEFLGTRQTGGIQFRIASLIRDRALLSEVHEAAEIMRQKYPEEAKALVAKWFSQGLEFMRV